MQLSKIRIDEEAKQFEFKDPFTGESFEKPILVKVYSTKSKVGKQSRHDMELKIIQLMQDKDNIIESENGKITIKPELIKDLAFENIADLVVDWSGIENEKGKEIKFSKKECIKAFNECEDFANAIYYFADNVGNYREK